MLCTKHNNKHNKHGVSGRSHLSSTFSTLVNNLQIVVLLLLLQEYVLWNAVSVLLPHVTHHELLRKENCHATGPNKRFLPF